MFTAHQGVAQQFTDILAGVIEPESPCVAWGDYDNDGDLDLLVAGVEAPSTVSTILYENTAGVFADSGISLLGLEFASAAWGDYDNDGDLDLAMIGRDSSEVAATRVYRNDGGTSFVTVGGSFTDVVDGALAWGDYDNDGDLDLVVTGITAAPGVGSSETRLYRNDGGVFTPVSHPFPDVHLSAVAWGDYDNDGDLDLMITGASSDAMSGRAGALFRNDEGGFVDAGAGLPAVQAGFAEWGDYDSDGDADLLLGGFSTGSITRLYQNNAGVLSDAAAGLPDLFFSAAGWGDYDNDGDLDIMIMGLTAMQISKLYRNDSGTFVDSAEPFPQLHSGVVAWADYDNDGDLDLALGGKKSAVPVDLLRIYEKNNVSANSAPTAPGNLSANVQGTEVTLGWDAASDGQTPSAGLSYSIRVGATPGGSEIASPQASASGYRLLPSVSNLQHGLSATLTGLAPGDYYWSVQAVDSGFLGSTFAAEGSFTVLPAPPEIVDICMEGDSVRVEWRGSPGSTYRVEESSDLTPGSWSEMATPTADMDGKFEILEILDDPPSPPGNYYRAVRP